MIDLQYPIGKFVIETPVDGGRRKAWIEDIRNTPANVRAAISGLSAEQLDTPYRLDGWTVRQVVHHLADSHMNAFVRFKLALTEEEPTIKPYDEKRWALCADSLKAPVELSAAMLDSLHTRWVLLLESLGPGDFSRCYQHPERGRVDLNNTLALYSWHGRHHTAHINSLRKRMGWS